MEPLIINVMHNLSNVIELLDVKMEMEKWRLTQMWLLCVVRCSDLSGLGNTAMSQTKRLYAQEV